jgi:hypothetical protein
MAKLVRRSIGAGLMNTGAGLVITARLSLLLAAMQFLAGCSEY